MTSTTQITIAGMDCPDCAERIERKLSRTTGVLSARINYATGEATISYDEHLVQPAKIESTIKVLGYQISNNKGKFGRLFFLGFAISLTLSIYLTNKVLSLSQRPFLIFQALLLVFIGGYPLLRKAYGEIVTRAPGMYTLSALSFLTAFFHSVIFGSNYFVEAGEVIVFISAGGYLEDWAFRKPRRIVEQLDVLQPRIARVRRNGQELQIPVEEIRLGDRVLVKPGERIPVDGIVRSGHSSVDESVITGESMPIEKTPGEKVTSASMNKFGILEIEATAVGEDTTFAHILRSIDEAQASRPLVQRIADRASMAYVPLVVLFAFVNYFLTGEILRSVAVLAIACPCSLAFATPAAVITGIGKAAKKKILVKGGRYLETAHKIDTIVFDKTGTLTLGEPELLDVIAFNGVKDVLRLAACAESPSEHPIARAVLRRAKEVGMTPEQPISFNATAGHGVTVHTAEGKILVGNAEFLSDNGVDVSEKIRFKLDSLQADGKTTILVALNNVMAGVLSIADKLRPESQHVVSALIREGHRVVLMTGDTALTAQAIAGQLGIEEVYSRVLPNEKAGLIKQLQNQGRTVAMVGDGINDAPGLAQADVGIAIGNIDITIETAHVALMTPKLENLLEFFRISRSSVRRIRENLFFAFGYNMAGIVAAALGFLQPGLAALLMVVGSLTVVVNSLRSLL